MFEWCALGYIYNSIFIQKRALTWKHIGGGIKEIRWAAAGGTGNTPPGIWWTPAYKEIYRSVYKDELYIAANIFEFSFKKPCR